MTEGTLLVNFDELDSLILKYNKYIGEYESEIAKFKSLVNSFSDEEWYGDDKNAFVEKSNNNYQAFSEMKYKFEEYYKIIVALYKECAENEIELSKESVE